MLVISFHRAFEGFLPFTAPYMQACNALAVDYHEKILSFTVQCILEIANQIFNCNCDFTTGRLALFKNAALSVIESGSEPFEQKREMEMEVVLKQYPGGTMILNSKIGIN